MYIVISQLVYGPAIETAAVTINKLVNTSTCRTDANNEVDYEEPTMVTAYAYLPTPNSGAAHRSLSCGPP